MTNQEKTMSGPTKKCQHCQTDIPRKAKKCPNCQSDLRSWFSRHPIPIFFIFLFIVFPFFIMPFIMPIVNIFSIFEHSFSSLSQSVEEQSTLPARQELLELVSWRCYASGKTFPYFHIVGEVKNISNEPLKSVAVVGTAYTEEGEFVKSDSTLIEYNPILPGQTSPFHVLFPYDPEMIKCKVGFKEFSGGAIPTKEE